MIARLIDRYDVRNFLDRLDSALHPRERVGIQWVIWHLVNVASSFLQFWRCCYGCGLRDSCKCEAGEPGAFVIDARTAWSVSWGIWRPTWDGRRHIPRPIPLEIVPSSTLDQIASRLHYISQRATSGPWKAVGDRKYEGEDWLVGSFGVDSQTDLNVVLTTDHVHASECGGEGALADAQFCAEVRNLAPQIVAALRSKATFEVAR